MRKALLVAMLSLALVAPALAGPYIDIPDGWVNFDGNGNFDQTIPGGSDAAGPLPIPVGAEVFGIGTITDVAMLSSPGVYEWLPADVGPNYEMSYSFWDAVVTFSSRTILPDLSHPGHITVYLYAQYADEARLVLVSDESDDFSNAAGPGAFNLVTGYYPTAYELPLGTDPNESLYLDLTLSGNSSVIEWSSWYLAQNPAGLGFKGGLFSAAFAEINGGYGAGTFFDYAGPDGSGDAFITTFSPLGWAYTGDTDIQLHAVPEPAALISLCAGLVLVGGYRLRKTE